MTHAEAQELLLDLAYGELDDARAAALALHLAGCDECQREKAALDEARRLTAPLREQEEPPPGFDDRILAASRAQAQLEHEGNIGQVVEVQGSVRPMGLEPAQVDAHAKVARGEEKRRPRWALRVALGGSVAAAAALALVMGTTLQQRHEAERAAASERLEIRIQPAAPQAPGAEAKKDEAKKDEAKKDEAARAQPVETKAGEPAKAEAKEQLAARAKKESADDLAELRAIGGGGDSSGPAASGTVASAPAGAAKAAPPPAAPALSEAPGTATRDAAEHPAEPAPSALAQNRVKAAAPSVAVAAKPVEASGAGVEQQAREARHAGDYPRAAALYRKAAALRRGEPAEAAWDLAHAVECLAASGNFDEARGVRDELAQLYPAEAGPHAAAGRVLREVDVPAQRKAKPAP